MESPEELSPKEKNVPGNHEISIHYVSIGEIWDRNKIVSTTYFYLKLLLTLLEVMMMNFEP